MFRAAPTRFFHRLHAISFFLGCLKVNALGRLTWQFSISISPLEPVPTELTISLEYSALNGQAFICATKPLPVSFEDLWTTPRLTSTAPNAMTLLYKSLWCSFSEIMLHSAPTAHFTMFGTKVFKIPAAKAKIACERHLRRFLVADIKDLLQFTFPVDRSRRLDADLDEEEREQLAKSRAGLNADSWENVCEFEYEQDALRFIQDRHDPILDVYHALIFVPPRHHMLINAYVRNESASLHIFTDYWKMVPFLDSTLDRLFA
eukprot:m.315041 g.315041  ORF g.315041 m.315041 type:complete len:261 (-) comp55425_c0_seq13:24-806(-)